MVKLLHGVGHHVRQMTNWVIKIMGYNLSKSKMTLRKPRRIFRTRKKIFRIFFTLSIAVSFLIPFPVNAIEKVKASALVMEETSASTPLSFTQKTPPAAKQKPDRCLSLLEPQAISSRYAMPHVSPGRVTRQTAGKAAVPVALGFVFGVRIALGPKEIVSANNRVQIGPELHATSPGRNTSHALAIAAYRSCKNKNALKQARR